MQRPTGDITLAKATDTRAMSCPEAFWDESFDGTPDRFIRRTGEYSFRGGVEQHNVLGIIYGDDRVHGRPDDASQHFRGVGWFLL